jgi:hypothetical protein
MPEERPSLAKQFGTDSAQPVRNDFWNPTLNIRFIEGHHMAFLYGQLVWMNYDSKVGIILQFSSHTVKLFGRHLEPLYAELLELRTRQITVVEEQHDLDHDDRPVVYRALVEANEKSAAASDEATSRQRKRRSE